MVVAFGAVLLLVVAGRGSLAQAAEFTCSGGNVACLIAAIRSANGLGEASTIRLAEGTYTLTAVDNDTDGPNGLPSVTRIVTIQGSGAQGTIIERAPEAPSFRLIRIAPTGTLTLEGLTLRGGNSGLNLSGGGILNSAGRVTLSHCRLVGNRLFGDGVGGGLFNRGGTVILTSSTVAENVAFGAAPGGGGLGTDGGSVTIIDSTIADNLAGGVGGGGGGIADISSASVAVGTIVNSTIVRNRMDSGKGGGGGGLIIHRGSWTISNSTIAGNEAFAPLGNAYGGGIYVDVTGVVSLRITILADNNAGGNVRVAASNCQGMVKSLDHNFLGDLDGCTLALQPHDRTGIPGLAIYTDDGTPGRGYWPLLPTSQAIDAGNAADCPPTDQLGRPRLGVCDIGAVEFYPPPDPFAAFVAGFYRYALGREPSATEVAGWVSFLRVDSTLDRARLMTHGFFDGPEYRARKVTRPDHVTALYRAILGRDPDASGLNGWVGAIQDRVASTVRSFIGSPEFHALVPSCQDEPAVRALLIRLYEKGLGRSPDVVQLENLVSSLMTNCDIGAIVVGFLGDIPRTPGEYVAILYRVLLSREPGLGEVAPWVEFLAAPFIEDQFIDSAEFAARWQQLLSSGS